MAAASALAAESAPDIARLRDRIIALGQRVRPDEAQWVAASAYATADQLRRDYRVVGPPLFHNFLVNVGIRKRGLCFQWAEDLLARLDSSQPSSLEFHWGEARAGTLREHNCVVVTSRGQPFRDGIVLDCWRHSGQLYWSALTADHYPWVENPLYAQVARSRRALVEQRNAGRETTLAGQSRRVHNANAL